jgi:hypothetical protein
LIEMPPGDRAARGAAPVAATEGCPMPDARRCPDRLCTGPDPMLNSAVPAAESSRPRGARASERVTAPEDVGSIRLLGEEPAAAGFCAKGV